jgi:hypothetical protein
MIHRRALVLGLALVAMCLVVSGQVVANPPFVNGGAVAYDPEISVVNSGVLQDVQATVSADRKYVTLTMRPSLTRVVNMFTFTWGGPTTQQVVGNPGGGILQNQPPIHGAWARNTDNMQRPLVRRAPTVLDQPGMSYVASP